MLNLGALAFASPWLLLGLAALPILWWLLRVTPPAPKRVRFPALRLLLGLQPREETPAKTPLWLIILRMVLAGLIILALAHPLLNPTAQLAGKGPLVLAVDNGWTAARHWDERRNTLDDLVASADREGRNVVLLPTAPLPGAAAPPPLSVMRPNDARAAVSALAPMPWPADRDAALARLAALDLSGAELVWLSDGIDDGKALSFAQGLQKHGPLRVLADEADALPRLLAPAEGDDKDLTATVMRADATGPAELSVRALGDDGRLLARSKVTLAPGATKAVAHLELPSELRNRTAEIAIEGEASAGAVLLLDERWRRRPVGVVTARGLAPGQPLLNGAYYLEKALNPFSEVREGGVDNLLKGDIAVLTLPDISPAGPAEKDQIVKWMENGGTVLRFAGPHLADETDDDLLPVTLRRGGRTLGGALSWETPASLAPFDASSPFAGLDVPKDVTISRQVLAEPTVDLGAKTWARLTDGTPLVTAERRGKGWLILVHTTGDPEWSTLGISGLFVNMLRRIVSLSAGVSGNSDKPLPPVETLDGYGRLQPPPAAASTIPAGGFADTLASAKFPPGFYGTQDARQALNLAPAVKSFKTLPPLPPGIEMQSYAKGPEVDFRPGLLGAALALALIDLVIAYALRGLLAGLWRGKRATTAGLVLLLAALSTPHAQAQGAAQSDDGFATKATSGFHLAFVRTGVPDVDAESQAGLTGLSNVLNRRTAVDAGQPMAVDIEHDELVFFPLLYWPVVPGEAPPSPQAVERINKFLSTGGTILFDTQDQGQSTPFSAGATQQRLQQIAAGLEIPTLMPVPPDHVLTKSFYLLQEFPGRWNGGTLWVEPVDDTVNDGVASVIVGSNDYAGAWAIDAGGRPLHAAVPGGEQQREIAYRFGVNLVMYALTGNYKNDQVHVPAILERLGAMNALANLGSYSLAAAPLLPWWAIFGFVALAGLALIFGAFRRARGTLWRLAGAAMLVLILLDPSLVQEQRQPQKDVAVVVVDESPSMRIGQRRQYADEALQAVTQRLAGLKDLDVRVVHAGAPDANAPMADTGTQLYTALSRALADVPRQRVAGAIMITDGEIHDMPPPAQLGLDAPLHVLLTGQPNEADRRLVVKDAPSFGLVGKEVQINVRIEDLPDGGSGTAQLTMRKDGGDAVIRTIAVGKDVSLTVPIDHGGPNVVELSVNAGPHELTLDNNRAALVVNGVRDRLKVLLVSGEPHQGERTWRNILKSDPSVDLIHFTILRPPEKQDGTPIRELSLIAFPIRELFDEKLDQFDLIIFDRYKQMNVLPPAYLENIARYVQKGGALLDAAGPSFGTPQSLYRTPLGAVLPAEPTGNVLEQGYVPHPTALGRRHPVTSDLPGLPTDPTKTPPWGRWFLDVEAQATRGNVVMDGLGDRPLLVLDRVGQGRVAELLSDEMWLWTRGYEGGGPQAELLRRVVYWLMKEPDLEENDLRAEVQGNRLVVTRQSLQPDDTPVTVTGPDGKPQPLSLAPSEGGRSTGSLPVTESGLYRITDGKRTALAAAGALNPIELADVRTTDQKVVADVTATGGGTYWVGPGSIPDIRRVGTDRTAAGHGWLGLRQNGDYVVTGVSEMPLLPGLFALLLALGAFLLAWRREGR